MALVKPWTDFPPPPGTGLPPGPTPTPAPTAPPKAGIGGPSMLAAPPDAGGTPPLPPPAAPAPPSTPTPPPLASTPAEQDPAYSPEQWAAWEQFKDPACPPHFPYRSQKTGGDNACVEKPDDCPDGKQAWGPEECRSTEWVAGHAGGGGGGAASGSIPGGGIEGSLAAQIQAMLGGSGTRYTPEVMQQLLAGVKQQAAGSAERGIASAKSDAAARGMLRSGRTGARLDAIRRGAEQQVTGATVDFAKAKIDADRQDRLDALDRAQKWLDSLRDHLYRTDLSQQQRQQFAANLTLAYAQIQAQFDQLKARAGYSALGV